MTIQGIIDKIKEFKEVVIESGLLRDIDGYITSFGQPQNKTNMSLLQDITDKMITSLTPIYTGDYPENFSILFPTDSVRPFTETDFLEKFNEIKGKTELNVNQLFQQLNTNLTQLKNSINTNNQTLDTLEAQISPFFQAAEFEVEEENRAILSIDFKNEATIGSLKNFSETLKNWDRSLFIYHQILSSESPQDITLVDIENGSIDIIINIDFNIAKSIIELFTAGLSAFTAYLVWKTQRASMAKSYNGNDALLKLDEQYEKELIKNVEEAVKNELIKQHQESLEQDKKLDSTSIDTKYAEVSKLLKEHIVKGNDIRLLSVGSEETEIKEKEKESQKLSKKVRKELKKLPKDDLIKMIGEFIPEEKVKKTTTRKKK